MQDSVTTGPDLKPYRYRTPYVTVISYWVDAVQGQFLASTANRYTEARAGTDAAVSVVSDAFTAHDFEAFTAAMRGLVDALSVQMQARFDLDSVAGGLGASVTWHPETGPTIRRPDDN